MDNVSLPVDVIDTSEVSIVDVQIDNEMKREVTDIGGNVDDTVGVKVLWSVDNSDLREFQVITDNNDKTLTDDPGKPLSLHDHVIEQALIRRDHHDDHIAGNGLHIVVAENIAESAIIGHHGNRLLAGDDSFSGDGISTRGGVPSSVVLSTETGMRVEEGHMLHVPDTDHSLLADSSSSMQVASSLASALTAQVDQDVIQLLLPSNGDHSSVGQAISISMGTSVDNTMTVSPPVHTLQSITFSDGSTAFIQHPTKFLEGQTITLDDGSTAVVQGLPGKLNMSSAAIATSVGTDGNNVTTADTQTVQLEDGTTGFLNQAVKDGLQAIVLEDGTTAYLATQQTPQFMENATLEATTFTLDQLTSQMPGMQALIPNTMINMDIKPQLVSPQTVISNIVEQQNKNIQMSTDMPNTLYVTSATPSDKSLAFGEKAYRCNYEGCGRLYTTMHHLKVHERSHTGDRPFRCEFADCEKAFATGYGLKSHTRVHTGEKPYKCPEDSCDKGFKTSGDLQKHVRTHTGERPFKCPFEGCTRSFTTSNIRKVHIRTHTGERPYVCPEDNCGRAFASATNYKNHVRIHTGEKPYICTVQGCGKRFTEYSSLYKHHVVHTHSKPYNCNRCGKTYRQTSTLAMHKRTAHGEDTTAETEAALFVGQEGYEPAGKRPRLNFTLMPEATPDEGEGTLIINTSEPTQLTLVDSENLGSVIAGATDPLGGIAANNQSSLLRNAGVATFTLGDQGQQVYVITDPAQLEALQQIAQQHLDSETAKDSGSCVTAPPGEIMKQEPGLATMDSGNSVVINNGNMTVNGCSIAMNTDSPETNSICEAAT